MSVTYSSGVYIFGTSKKYAVLKEYNGFNNHILPKKISIQTLAILLATMQAMCFDDTDIESNTRRLAEMLSPGGGEKTVALVLSLGYLDGVTDINNFVDSGSATIQMSNQGLLKIQQPWVNEVCRAKMTDDDSQFLKPVKVVMELIDNYILTDLAYKRKGITGVYLYIEKNPKYGNASGLLDYYHNKYGYNQIPEFADDDYHYMGKSYVNDSPPKKRSATSTRRKSASLTRKPSASSTRKTSASSTRKKSSSL
jgi:hypothetical protein